MSQVARTLREAGRNEFGVAGIGYARLDYVCMGNKRRSQVSLP